MALTFNIAAIYDVLKLLTALDNDQLTIDDVRSHFKQRATLTAQGKQELFDNMALRLNKALPYLTQEKQNIARPIINKAIQIFEKAYNETEEKLKNKLTEYEEKDSAKTQVETAATQIQAGIRGYQARKVYEKMKKEKEQAKQEEQSSELFDKPSRFSDESIGNVDLSNPILLAEQVGEEANQIEQFFSSHKSKEIEEAGLDFIISMGVIQRVLELLTELDNDELTIDEVREIEILTAQEKKEFFDFVVSPLNNSLSYLAQEEQNIARPIVNKAIQIFEKAYNETEEKQKNKLTEYKAKDSAKTQVEKATQIQAQVRGHQARNVYGEMKQKKEQEKKNTPVVSTPSDIPVYLEQFKELCNQLSHLRNASNAHLIEEQKKAVDSLLEVIHQNFDAFSNDKTRTNFETFLTRSTASIENAKNAFSTVKTDSKKTVWVQFLDLLNAMYTTVLNLFTCMKSESKPGLFQSETTNQVLNKIDLDSIASQLQGIGSAMEKDIVIDKEMKL